MVMLSYYERLGSVLRHRQGRPSSFIEVVEKGEHVGPAEFDGLIRHTAGSTRTVRTHQGQIARGGVS